MNNHSDSHSHLWTTLEASWPSLHVFEQWDETHTGEHASSAQKGPSSLWISNPEPSWGDGANHYATVTASEEQEAICNMLRQTPKAKFRQKQKTGKIQSIGKQLKGDNIKK